MSAASASDSRMGQLISTNKLITHFTQQRSRQIGYATQVTTSEKRINNSASASSLNKYVESNTNVPHTPFLGNHKNIEGIFQSSVLYMDTTTINKSATLPESS